MSDTNETRKVRCPICYASIETDEVVVDCPACKERIYEKLAPKDSEGLTTAVTDGPGLRSVKNLTEDVH